MRCRRVAGTCAAMVLVASAFSARADGPGRGDPWLDYALECQGCHLAEGSGSEQAGVPGLVGVGRFLGVEGGTCLPRPGTRCGAGPTR